MWHVYRLINRTKKQVYHGVAIDQEDRIENFHKKGETKAIAHWNWDKDTIIKKLSISEHYKQEHASSIANDLEKTYIHIEGFENIITSGI